MGTQAAPNLVMSLIDLSDGSLDTGKTVELLAYGGSYPTGAIALTEIGTTGRYKKETAGGAAAVTQGIYLVYVGGTLEGVFVHGYEGVAAHIADVTGNPHAVVASQVNITDTGEYFTGSTTELALQEIGAALATKASTLNTILTDDSTQSVDSSKAKVTNLNADKLDGYHAGTNANQIPPLNASGKFPESMLPLSLPNINVGKVGGLQPGVGNNNLAVINTQVVAGLLHTSVLGKAVGAAADMIPLLGTGSTKLRISLLGVEVGALDGNLIRVHSTKQAGYIHDSLLNKEVGVTDDDIPQISTDAAPEAGKIHESLLGQMGGRIATNNQGDAPAPTKYGGGVIWFEQQIVKANVSPIVIDTSIDWRDRFIHVIGYMQHTSSDVSDYRPGGILDTQVFGASRNQTTDGDNPISVVQTNLAELFLYTRDGVTTQGAGEPSGSMYLDSDGGTTDDGLSFYADEATGNLICKKGGTARCYNVLLKIEYSPDQGHYS